MGTHPGGGGRAPRTPRATLRVGSPPTLGSGTPPGGVRGPGVPPVPSPARMPTTVPGPLTRERTVPRTLKLALFALVLTGLVGGSTAWYLATQKSLTLTVDGQDRVLTTTADTAGAGLAGGGLRTQAHNVVLPEPDAEVVDGDTAAVTRARPPRGCE